MTTTTRRYIGLMSGTSIDGIDAAILEINGEQFKLSHTLSYELPKGLQLELATLCNPGDNEIERMGKADHQLGILFAEAANQLLASSGIHLSEISAIGSHGQTIRHIPTGDTPFTLQIGDPNLISQRTGIITVADFRRKDMAAGGQGAPLAPAFHQAAFGHPDLNRVIVNIGGIANITPIIKGKATQGFDTGPGNGLMDYWIGKHQQKSYDNDGAWGESGTAIPALLEQMLAEPYLQLAAPKSTGRELFNQHWLDQQLGEHGYQPTDVQATLQQLTARSITTAIQQLNEDIDEIYICGGGAYNQALMEILSQANNAPVTSTSQLNIEPEWVEAAAFAWLAHQTLENLPGNLPQATGASTPCILGAIYPA